MSLETKESIRIVFAGRIACDRCNRTLANKHALTQHIERAHQIPRNKSERIAAISSKFSTRNMLRKITTTHHRTNFYRKILHHRPTASKIDHPNDGCQNPEEERLVQREKVIQGIYGLIEQYAEYIDSVHVQNIILNKQLLLRKNNSNAKISKLGEYNISSLMNFNHKRASYDDKYPTEVDENIVIQYSTDSE